MTVTSPDPLATLTVEQLADKLQVSKSSIERKVRAGMLPSFMFGGRRLFRTEDVAAYIATLVDQQRPMPLTASTPRIGRRRKPI